jgi:hypothetical protein
MLKIKKYFKKHIILQYQNTHTHILFYLPFILNKCFFN